MLGVLNGKLAWCSRAGLVYTEDGVGGGEVDESGLHTVPDFDVAVKKVREKIPAAAYETFDQEVEESYGGTMYYLPTENILVWQCRGKFHAATGVLAELPADVEKCDQWDDSRQLFSEGTFYGLMGDLGAQLQKDFGTVQKSRKMKEFYKWVHTIMHFGDDEFNRIRAEQLPDLPMRAFVDLV